MMGALVFASSTVSPSTPPRAALPVDDLGDVRDGRAQHLDGAAGHVPGLSAAGAVAQGADDGALGCHRPVLAQGAVGLPYRRTEGDLTGGGVQGDVPVVRGGRGERRDCFPIGPAGPAVVLGGLQQHRRGVTDHGGVGEAQPLPGQTGGLAERLVVHGLGVYGRGGAAEAERLRGADGRGGGVEGLVGQRFGDPAAQPAGLLSAGAGEGVPAGDVQDDLAGPVQAAGAVPVDLALGPAVLGPRLPDQRRLPRVHADAVDPAVQLHPDRAVRHGGAEPEQHAVAGPRGLGEAHHVLALGEVGGPVGDGITALLDHEMPQLAGHDGQFVLGREDRGLLALGARGGDLGAHRQEDRLLLRRGEPERDLRTGRGGREQRDAHQIQERQVVLLRHPVEPVDDLVGHVGDRLHQGDARVGDVVVGPLRGALLDVALGVVDELLEAAVVEVRGGQGHQRSLSGAGSGSSWEGMT
ncbi:hypothetical protein QF035_005668 [Streptomyces umbrinus]|uniref:Uncharacterized protein n=1 Tax=Streptomyces umbrinus TaxID=67370 RepID=A0ABU0SX04_9ACTN|nr:hypothetical protein [Streptomyces umbrinus]